MGFEISGDVLQLGVGWVPLANPVFDQPGEILFLGCRVEFGEFENQRPKIGVVVEVFLEKEVDSFVGLGTIGCLIYLWFRADWERVRR